MSDAQAEEIRQLQAEIEGLKDDIAELRLVLPMLVEISIGMGVMATAQDPKRSDDIEKRTKAIITDVFRVSDKALKGDDDE